LTLFTRFTRFYFFGDIYSNYNQGGMQTVIAQFIPIIVMYALFSNPVSTILFSQTVFGKLLVLLIVIFYTSIDTLLGLCVGLLIMAFYQSTYVENVLNKGAPQIENSLR